MALHVLNSKMGWKGYAPPPCPLRTHLCGSSLQWDEVSVLDDQRRLTRTFEACHVAGAAPGLGQDNWLQTHFVAENVFINNTGMRKWKSLMASPATWN